MQIRNYITSVALLGMSAVLMTGCSDDDKWQPGPDTDPNNMSVYFEELSTYNLVVEPDDSRLIPVTVGRSKVGEAATVYLDVVECPEGVVIPQTIAFGANDQTTTFYIDLENMPSKSFGNISINLPEELTSPYGAGTTNLSFKVTISGAWIPVSTDVKLTCSPYADMTTSLYYLDGTNNFKLPDFFGSGLDFVFTMDTPGNGWTYIQPIKNYYDATLAYPDLGWGAYPYDAGWFLFDDANDEWPWWCPDGVTYPEIDMLEFEKAYAYMTLKGDDGKGWIYLSAYAYMSDGSGKYIDLNYSFTPEFTPYEN